MTSELMRRSGRTAATLWTVLFVVISGCLLIEATPHLTYHRPAQRGKNWCAYIVNKNVSCTVMDGTESFVQPQYKCSWNQIHCQPTLTYKLGFRPRYITSYKVVTEMEWRCCPGFKGEDCKEGPSDKAKQTPIHTPRPSGGKKDPEPNGQRQQPLDAKRDFQELNQAQEKKIQTLEEEMLRLTQSVIDLQTSLAGVNENLKITVQEDTSKFLNTWLNNLTPTASATGGKTEYYLPGFTGSAEKEDGLKDLVSELTSTREELRQKTDQIEELTRKINLYEERLIDIEEMTRQSTEVTPGSNVKHQLEALRDEMLEGMDRKIADMKNSCEYKLNNVQQQCEENENSCTEVKDFILEKETELRNEINDLRSQIVSAPKGGSNCCNNDIDAALKNLGLKVDRIAEANLVLNARLDNEVQRLSTLTPDQSWNEKLNDLEFKVNVSEKNVEEHCFYIEDTLRGLINNTFDNMNDMIDWKLQLLENQLGHGTNDHHLGDSGSSIPNSVFKEVNELRDMVQKLGNDLKTALDGKNGSLSDSVDNNYAVLVQTQLDNTLLFNSLTETIKTMNELIENKTSDLEGLKTEVGNVKFELYRIDDNVDLLNDRFDSLKDQIKYINSSINDQQLGLTAKLDIVQKHFDTISDASINGHCCNNLQDSFEVLKRELTADKGKCPENSQGIRTDLSNVDARVSKLENVCGKLDTISGSLQRIKDGLNKHVTSLWNCINRINGTIKSHSNDIYGLKNSVQVFQTQITQITTDLQDLTKSKPGEGSGPKHTIQVQVVPQSPPRTTEKPKYPQVPQEPVYPQVPIIPSIPNQPAQPQEPLYPAKPDFPSQPGQPQLPLDPASTEPRQPPSKPEPPTSSGSIVIPLVPPHNGVILEHGQAGPPGRMVQTGSARPQGADGEQEMEMSKGFAGAPGYPKPAEDTKDQISIIFSESKGATATTVHLSFSAGLTDKASSIDVGFITFNNVLVNDGDHYNPNTGIFTAPIEGRYMLSAVLTPEHGHYVEAVLLVSNVSVAQLDSSGYRRELLEYHRPSSSRPVCSGVGIFNLILNLKAGDEVGIVLTGGKLANSDSDEMYSTFSGVLLYPTTPLR